MNIAWVFGEQLYWPPSVDVGKIKNSAPIWGSWRLWRSYQIDNAVCADVAVADRLIAQEYYNYCNLYVPHQVKTAVSKVKHFGGTFDCKMPQIEDFVAMHLAAHLNDIVLVAGTELESADYRTLFIKTVSDYPSKQWVLIDYVGKLPKELDQSNITCDKLETVLQLLS